jgi:hypothetical protein
MTETTSTATGQQDDMMLFPIPKRLYPDVLQYLGDLYVREASTQSVPEQQPVQAGGSDDPHRAWTREDVRRLKTMARNPTVLAVFEIAKEQEGELVSIRELENRTGRRYGQVRADLAGLTRMCRARLNHANWPFNAVWAADGKPQMSYLVPDDVLQWWYED